MYNYNPYNSQFNQQYNQYATNNYLNELQQMKERIDKQIQQAQQPQQQPQIMPNSQPTNLTQNFQLAPQTNNNSELESRYGRNYRSQEDFNMMLEDLAEDGMELARNYEDASEMASNGNEKQRLMKMAEREKEHYKTVKEMIERKM